MLGHTLLTEMMGWAMLGGAIICVWATSVLIGMPLMKNVFLRNYFILSEQYRATASDTITVSRSQARCVIWDHSDFSRYVCDCALSEGGLLLRARRSGLYPRPPALFLPHEVLAVQGEKSFSAFFTVCALFNTQSQFVEIAIHGSPAKVYLPKEASAMQSGFLANISPQKPLPG